MLVAMKQLPPARCSRWRMAFAVVKTTRATAMAVFAQRASIRAAEWEALVVRDNVVHPETPVAEKVVCRRVMSSPAAEETRSATPISVERAVNAATLRVVKATAVQAGVRSAWMAFARCPATLMHQFVATESACFVDPMFADVVQLATLTPVSPVLTISA